MFRHLLQHSDIDSSSSPKSLFNILISRTQIIK